MLKLRGRSIEKSVSPEKGMSLLDIALKHKIDWNFSCTRGTCARCRCHVEEGMDILDEVTDAELNRLTSEEIEQGYRLGCQAVVKQEGTLRANNQPYF